MLGFVTALARMRVLPSLARTRRAESAYERFVDVSQVVNAIMTVGQGAQRSSDY
jgi:hypothetical protein